MKFDLNAPLRLALSPSGTELVVAMAGGGLLIVRISPGADELVPVLSLDQGEREGKRRGEEREGRRGE